MSAGVLDPQGPIASSERLILLNATTIMLVVVIPVIVATLAVAWRYRASNQRAIYSPDWAFSGTIELVVWAIPALVVILLANVEWIGSHDLDPAAPIDAGRPPLKIEVASLDWKWLFIYPEDGVATINQLVIPAGTPIQFVLTSATVMNAFFVPQLGSMIYTMPGMTTRLNLLADRPGDYPGLSSHFSGEGFSDMRFMVHVLPDAEYGRWIARAHDDGPGLTAAVYMQLSQPSSNLQPQIFGQVESGLYGEILQTAAPLRDAARAQH
jgi:cytochrome o ubiquinol oxidase subunit 2